MPFGRKLFQLGYEKFGLGTIAGGLLLLINPGGKRPVGVGGVLPEQ